MNTNFPFTPKRWPFFYGYWIVFVSAVGFVLSTPGQTIGVSVFTDHLIQALGVTRFQLSMAYAVGTVLSAVIIARISKYLDIWGTRMVAMISATGLGIFLLYMSQVDRIAGIFTFSSTPFWITTIALICVTFGFLFMRLTGQGMLALCSRTMLMRWFVVRRGTMNSIMGVFVSLVFSASPLFFDLMIRRFNWRGSWMIMGFFMMTLFAGFIFLFFRDNPESCDLIADGPEHQKNQKIEEEENISWTLQKAKKTYTFWLFNFGTAMFSLYITAITFHVVSIFELHGYTRTDAISIFFPASWIAVSLSLTAGFCSDLKTIRYRLKYFLVLLLSGMILSSIGILSLENPAGKYLLIVGNGMASGFFGLCSSVVWGRYYGRKHLGEITGHNMSYLVFFSAIGPSLFALSLTLFGNYSAALLFCIIIMIILLGLAFRANRPSVNYKSC